MIVGDQRQESNVHAVVNAFDSPFRLIYARRKNINIVYDTYKYLPINISSVRVISNNAVRIRLFPLTYHTLLWVIRDSHSSLIYCKKEPWG